MPQEPSHVMFSLPEKKLNNRGKTVQNKYKESNNIWNVPEQKTSLPLFDMNRIQAVYSMLCNYKYLTTSIYILVVRYL